VPPGARTEPGRPRVEPRPRHPTKPRYALAGPIAETPADDPSSSYVAVFLATSDLALVKAFVSIEDPKLRRAIVRLVEEIVPETGSSNED
jgi:hypothetical protein